MFSLGLSVKYLHTAAYDLIGSNEHSIRHQENRSILEPTTKSNALKAFQRFFALATHNECMFKYIGTWMKISYSANSICYQFLFPSGVRYAYSHRETKDKENQERKEPFTKYILVEQRCKKKIQTNFLKTFATLFIHDICLNSVYWCETHFLFTFQCWSCNLLVDAKEIAGQLWI